jgi:Derlin-2/3
MGILAGHVWWFCSSYLPLHAPANLKRSNPLRAPIRWKALFNDNAGRLTRTSWGGMRQGGTTSVNNSSGSATALQSRPQDRSEAVEAVRHRWGGGQKLGGSGI